LNQPEAITLVRNDAAKMTYHTTVLRPACILSRTT